MKNLLKSLLIAISAILFTISCEKNDDPVIISSEDSIYWFVNDKMENWYYWNEEMPSVDYLSFTNPKLLMKALMVPEDKFSFIEKAQTVSNTFELGEEFSFGFYLARDIFNDLRVFIAYENSTAYQQGIRRGWLLEEIDDVPQSEITNFDDFFSMEPVTMKFKFRDHNSTAHTITLSKETFFQNAVFNERIFEIDGKQAGYFVYQSFLGFSKAELITVMTEMQSNGVDDLIIDLRYNGGGYVTIADSLADMLIPAAKVGEVFYTTKHNSNKTIYNYQQTFRNNDLNLNLDRVFFITNQYSASASELIVNGLRPHMNVIQIGDRTYGKPFSMYGFIFQDWLMYPVTAKSFNADNFGDYEDGLIPDVAAADNHNYDWGDPQDPAIAQAIHYIRYGNFDGVATVFKTTQKPDLLGAEEKFNRAWQIHNSN